MAILAPSPPSNSSRPDTWISPAQPSPQVTSNTAANSTSYTTPVTSPSGPMTDIMSYQYPAPPQQQNGAEMDGHSQGYMPGYPIAQSGSMEVRNHAAGLPAPSGSARIPASKVMKLKRSVPIVRQQMSAADHQAALANDKRRNKLGYHRTSVACGHCRRRKIRCIPSPSDHQGKCVNCHRLKKDCSFYPVDQQPPTDARGKPPPPTRSATAPKMGSSDSSPSMQGGQPDLSHGQSSVPPSATRGSFDYPQTMSSQPWMAPEASPSTTKPSDLNTNWRGYPQESPITPSFSPYTPNGPPQSSAWTSPVAPSDTTPRDGMGWDTFPPPTRSMSYNGESTINSHHHSGHYPPMAQQPPTSASRAPGPYDRKSGSMSEIYPPPPISTSIAGMDGGVAATSSIDSHVPLSAGAVTSTSYGGWSQPQYSYKPESGYGSWYGSGNGDHSSIGGHHDPAPPVSDGAPPAANIYYATR